MDMHYLLSLPMDVSCCVIGSWLAFASVVRLAAACQYSQFDTSMYIFFRSHNFTFHGQVDGSKYNVVVWLMHHRVKASNIVLNSLSKKPLISDYMQGFGSSIRSVACLQGLDSTTTFVFAVSCQNITKISWSDGEIPRTFRDVLIMCRDLRELHFQRPFDRTQHVFKNLSFKNLHILTVRDYSALRGEFPWSESTSSESLTTVDVERGIVPVSLLCSIAQNCPRLQAMRLHDVRMNDSTLRQFAAVCSSLLHLDISGNWELTDDGVLAVVSNLHNLKSINIQECPATTDVSCGHVARIRGDTLETIYMDIVSPNNKSTEEIIAEFGTNCITLKYLNVFCDDYSLDRGSCAYSIVRACPSLSTFVVNHANAIGVTARRFITDFRPSLTIVEHSQHTEYRISNML